MLLQLLQITPLAGGAMKLGGLGSPRKARFVEEQSTCVHATRIFYVLFFCVYDEGTTNTVSAHSPSTKITCERPSPLPDDYL